MTNRFTDIKKSVSFVFVGDEKGNLTPYGTGFFVGVKLESDEKQFSVYFVTAKHVLQDKQGNYFPEIVLRLNTLTGDSRLIRLLLGKIEIFVHEDSDVDIAVFRCLPDENVFDYRFLSSELIADKEVIEKYGIMEGDEVFFAGLFTAHMGQKRNQPIIRFGKVALMPEEKVAWPEEGKPPKLVDLYLMECLSFGGNSGSPVFFQLNPFREPGSVKLGKPQMFLAGVMKGHFQGANQVQITKSISNLTSLQNIGISGVIPASKLHEILFSRDVIELRARTGK